MSRFVYVVGPHDGPVKIGSTGNIMTRLSELQTGNGARLIIHDITDMADTGVSATIVERETHCVLDGQRGIGEWFQVSPDDAIAAITAALANIRRASK